MAWRPSWALRPWTRELSQTPLPALPISLRSGGTAQWAGPQSAITPFRPADQIYTATDSSSVRAGIDSSLFPPISLCLTLWGRSTRQAGDIKPLLHRFVGGCLLWRWTFIYLFILTSPLESDKEFIPVSSPHRHYSLWCSENLNKDL